MKVMHNHHVSTQCWNMNPDWKDWSLVQCWSTHRHIYMHVYAQMWIIYTILKANKPFLLEIDVFEVLLTRALADMLLLTMEFLPYFLLEVVFKLSLLTKEMLKLFLVQVVFDLISQNTMNLTPTIKTVNIITITLPMVVTWSNNSQTSLNRSSVHGF